MEQNKLNVILIIFNLLIVVSYFAVSNIYIKDDMSKKLQMTEDYIVKEEWKKAEAMSKEIEKDWSKSKYFIMCNYGETEFDGFEDYINNITGSVKAKSLDSSLTTILSAQDAWQNLNKIIPSP